MLPCQTIAAGPAFPPGMARGEAARSPAPAGAGVEVEDRRSAHALRRVIERLVGDGLGEVVDRDGVRRVVARPAVMSAAQVDRVRATDEMLSRHRRQAD